MNGEVTPRCATGIEGFDSISQGGFVKNSSNVIIGGPGSGKSTFLLQFLYNGVTKYDENGLYCSFEPDILDTLNDAFSHGWDFYRLAEEGRIKFIKFSPETSIDELKNELTRLISQNDIKRICFDPVSVLALNISDVGKVRERIFDLVSLMKRLKVTSVLSDECLENENGFGDFKNDEWSKTDIIRYLSDSVTIFYTTGLSGDADRAIKVEKMRRTNHKREYIGMKLKDNGVEILSKSPLKSVEQDIKMQSQQRFNQSQSIQGQNQDARVGQEGQEGVQNQFIQNNQGQPSSPVNNQYIEGGQNI
jgi:circadian clock protein KaiC